MIDVRTDQKLDEVSKYIDSLPLAFAELKKAARFAARDTARMLASKARREFNLELGALVSSFKKRFHINVSKSGDGFSVWAGIDPVRSLRQLGRVRQLKLGAKAGKKNYKGTFYNQYKNNVFIRVEANEKHGYYLSKEISPKGDYKKNNWPLGVVGQLVPSKYAVEAERLFNQADRLYIEKINKVIERLFL